MDLKNIHIEGQKVVLPYVNDGLYIAQFDGKSVSQVFLL